MQQQVQWVLDRLQGKDKARPTKAELIKLVDLHFNGCQCEATTHTISEKVGGYAYTITRSVDLSKDKEKGKS